MNSAIPIITTKHILWYINVLLLANECIHNVWNIQVNKLVLDAELAEDELRFLLKSHDPNGASFIIQAESHEQKQQVVAQINKLLDHQQSFLAMLQQPQASMPSAQGNKYTT